MSLLHTPAGHSMVLEYIRSQPLSNVLTETKYLTVEAVRAVISQVSSAVAHVAERGYVHCSICPENILLSGSETLPHALLVGFRRAHRAVHSVDYALDVWSLGIATAAALARRPPDEICDL